MRSHHGLIALAALSSIAMANGNDGNGNEAQPNEDKVSVPPLQGANVSAEAGKGVTFLPDTLLKEFDQLVPIPSLNFGTIERTVGLYYKRHQPLSEGAKRFVAICDDHFGNP